MKNKSSEWVTLNYIKDIDSKVIKSNTQLPVNPKKQYRIFSYIKSLYQNTNKILNIMTYATREPNVITPKLEVSFLEPFEKNDVILCRTADGVYRATYNKTFTFNVNYLSLNILFVGLGVCTWTIKYRTNTDGVYSNWITIFSHHNGGNWDRLSTTKTLFIDESFKKYNSKFFIELSVYMDSWYKYNYAVSYIISKGKLYELKQDVINSGELHYVLIEQ